MRIRLQKQRANIFLQSLRTMGNFCKWVDGGVGGKDISPWGSHADDLIAETQLPKEMVEAEYTMDRIGELFDTLAMSKNKSRLVSYFKQIKSECDIFISQLGEYVDKKTK